VVLSLILMTTTVFPHIDVVLLSEVLGGVLVAGLALGGIIWLVVRKPVHRLKYDEQDRREWRMPSLNLLTRPPLLGWRKWTLVGMAGYLVLSVILLVVKAFQIG